MSLTIYRRGKVWHYRGTVSRQRLRGSCRTTDKAIAEQVANRLEAKAWKRDLHGAGAVLTFANAAAMYRRSHKPTRFLAKVEDYWRDTLASSINGTAVRQGALAVFGKHSNATKNRQFIVPTQAIINYAAEAELCPHLKVKRFPVAKKIKKPATWEWVQALMAAAPPKTASRACFLFLTGARISEAISLCWEDVDLTRRRALLRQGKTGGDERSAHLPQPLLVALANLPGERIGRVWDYATRRGPTWAWNTAIKKAGIEHLSFHACRHGFATGLLHQRIDPITVAKRGGWKSPAHVFATYGHAMEDETVSELLTGTPRAQSLAAKPKRAKISNS